MYTFQNIPQLFITFLFLLEMYDYNLVMCLNNIINERMAKKISGFTVCSGLNTYGM